jgi:two-component system sensor histidine kinase EvgS
MTADLLELINDRTGLVFRPSKITSVDAMISRVQRDPVSIIGALTYSERRDASLAFSRPYLVNPFVLVTRAQAEHAGLTGMKGQRVAIIKGSAAAKWLEREWPDIQREEVDVPIESYELLAEGRVEGVIQPQLSAAYLIDRFFRARLQIDSVIGSQPALIGFATGQQNADPTNSAAWPIAGKTRRRAKAAGTPTKAGSTKRCWDCWSWCWQSWRGTWGCAGRSPSARKRRKP